MKLGEFKYLKRCVIDLAADVGGYLVKDVGEVDVSLEGLDLAAANACAKRLRGTTLRSYLPQSVIDEFLATEIYQDTEFDDDALDVMIAGENGLKNKLVDQLGADGLALDAFLNSAFDEELSGRLFQI